jgi:Uma2 family endonuclease
LFEDEAIRVPEWVVDLESFRRWTDDDSFPETGQISYLTGEVWIDMSKEQLFTHNEVKSEINTVLRTMVKAERLGRYFHDGAFLSNTEADISNQPDGIFVSTEALHDGRVRVIEGRTDGHVELEGSPDMVLEVVSRSSVEKDTEALRVAYAVAGVREYWLVDARTETIRFDILRQGRSGYTAVRKRAGWVRSEVFSQWFRLSRQAGEDGYPEFSLEAQADSPGT